ncbi:MAG TPA: DEAD/DEAH box helicase [Clostridium sp.]
MMNNFDEFNLQEEIVKALEALEYTIPTKVQEQVIPKALLGKNLTVQAQTGTGKTASFVIPLCEKISWEENSPQALILAPTRELAIQICEDVKNIGRFKRLKATAVYGKSPFKDQARELKSKTHIVVGTPGRVLDHIDKGTFNTKDLKYLIIDEADEMLNMGFISQVEDVIENIPKKRTTMVFSATLPEEVAMLCSKYMDKPVNIKIESESLITNEIEHFIYRSRGDDKLECFKKLLIKEKPDTAVAFCKTKENVELAYQYLRALGYSVGKIHGGMLQKQRIEAMQGFKRGDFRILIATDVAARGIDVEGITHVINLDIPLEKEAYVHRIGRTGRAGKKGKAITFVTQFEDRFLKEINEYIGFDIEEREVFELKTSKAEEEVAVALLKKSGGKKVEKAKSINKDITKIYFNGGKKKKLRAVDFVGTISNIEGVSVDDIGIIEIQDAGSYVEILNGKGKTVLEALKNMTIKGKTLKIEIARKN